MKFLSIHIGGMNIPKQNQEDFKRHLGEQIHFLIKSAESYDKGDFLEAKRLTVHLRALLHDTTHSTSLLSHLNKKEIGFYDTSIEYPPSNILPEIGLVIYQFQLKEDGSSIMTFLPPLNNGPPSRYVKGKVPFDIWWNKKIIDDKKENTLTRKDLVLAVCNHDGGAHIDAKLKKAYSNIIGDKNITIKTREGDGIVLSDPLSANIRQISYEVLKSLEDEFPEYFKD